LSYKFFTSGDSTEEWLRYLLTKFLYMEFVPRVNAFSIDFSGLPGFGDNQGFNFFKGPKGDTGPHGLQGEKGNKGDNGDESDTGPQGPHGEGIKFGDLTVIV
jgi:hypothetical protein